jgi:hypothetical protein
MQISNISTAVPIVPATTGGATVSPAKTASPPGSGQPSAPPPPEAAAASTATSILESSIYSTSFAGKSYSANISQADGTYTLSVPNLPDSTVSGSTLSAAENALNMKIDILV